MARIKRLADFQRAIKYLGIEHLKLFYLLCSIKKIGIIKCFDKLAIVLFLQYAT